MTRALLLILALTGCATFPEVDKVTAKSSGKTPPLLPIADLTAQVRPTLGSPDTALAGRAAALQARAAALRGQ